MKKTTEKRLIDFNGSCAAIQEYADLYCGGNFSFAVRELVQAGLLMGAEKCG